MFTLRFAFKNIISRKSSLVIVLFIAFSIGILIMANAVFDGTGNGIEKTFSTSFTGDVVIRPATDFPMSLFGDETPVTGQLSELPRITPFNNVMDYVKNCAELKEFCPQLTGQAAIKIGGYNRASVVFGVVAEDYLKIMSGIHVVKGEPYKTGQKGMMVSKNVLESICRDSGTALDVGSDIQLISSNGSSYTLRSAPITAVYEYDVHNDLQDNIILVDPDTVRSLLGIESMSSSVVAIDESQSAMIDGVDNIEDLFGDDFSFEQTENAPEENSTQEQSVVEGDSQNEVQTSWNYIICRLNDGEKPGHFVKKLNKFFNESEYNVTAISWRAAAGMSAQYIYWMRLIFNIGLILLIGTGFIVVNNTLIIAAIDRTKETGALRAIGADRRFIGVEYLFETLMLTITAGILGCFIGMIGNQILVNAHITFSNTYLIQLFGGTQLKTNVTLSNLGFGMLLSLLLAVIGWLYPVHIALDTSPVVAMEHI
ncbi:ABC transporter permease [Treponema sp.]|uniref:ABC transporter permease n=1 Tax=Treponema sp. TaxID=166 RepID=UPI00298D91E6|nr:FtsX-like permease family protein [Treponema sp.]MCR5612881.1 FtsX-like permease family protein [Treponema sp.]